MIELLGWLGNIFLVGGFILVARKNNLGQIFNALGCGFYLVVGVMSGIVSMVFLELFLGIISIIGYLKWKKRL